MHLALLFYILFCILVHIILRIGAYYFAYFAYFAYCNMQNMTNMHLALLFYILFCILVHIILHIICKPQNQYAK
jgi:hypothetical protein